MEALTLLKVLLPRIPLVIKTAILHAFGLTPASKVQNMELEVVITLIRSITQRRVPFSRAQKVSLFDPGIRGRKWVAKCVLPACEDDTTSDEVPDVRLALAGAIRELGDGNETYVLPEVKSVEAEWTGYRSDVGKYTTRPNLWEAEQYKKMMADDNLTSDTTVLYLHGGAYVVMDPSTHRDSVAEMCRLIHGRALSVRYRLAPQHPFPAALLDAFIAYLSLLYPPPESFHDPVIASDIIFAGDSSGGGLCTALMLTLLTLRRIGIHKIRFHGDDVDLVLPGGMALVSPWNDYSRCLPSLWRNAKYDYLEPPSKAESITPKPERIPPDHIWPARPPRVEPYCDATMILHPLVSPLAASEELWDGHPPVWMSTGSEILQDEHLVFARRLQATGICVLEMFEGMPHVFPFIFRKLDWSKEWFKDCTTFITAFATRDQRLKSSSREWRRPKGPRPFDLDAKVAEFVGDDAEVDRRMLKAHEWRLKAEEEMISRWKNSSASDKSSSDQAPPKAPAPPKSERQRIEEVLSSGALV